MHTDTYCNRAIIIEKKKLFQSHAKENGNIETWGSSVNDCERCCLQDVASYSVVGKYQHFLKTCYHHHHLPWWCRQQFPLKSENTSTDILSVTSQKTENFKWKAPVHIFNLFVAVKKFLSSFGSSLSVL